MLIESVTLFQLLKPKEPTLPQPTPPETHQVDKNLDEVRRKLDENRRTKLYVIKRGDSLSKIGKVTNTPWKNIWAANKRLKHQDKLPVGVKLVIPKGKIRPRKLIQAPRRAVKPTPKQSTVLTKKPYGGANTYEPGSCTWHVKNLAPWVPNGLGDASSWYGNAPSYGLNTSPVARVGAVGWTPGHVVFIKAVRGSEVLVSEMNYDWVAYHQREAWFPASKYQYIY